MNSHFNRSDQQINAPPPHPCVAVFILFCFSRRETQAQSKATISHGEKPQACLLRRSQVVDITILASCPQLSSNSHQAVFTLMTLLSLLRLLQRNIHHFLRSPSCLSLITHPSRKGLVHRLRLLLLWSTTMLRHYTTKLPVQTHSEDAKERPFCT